MVSEFTLYNEELAKKKGHKSRTDYVTSLAKKRGRTIAEDRNIKAQQEGYKNYEDKLNTQAIARGFESITELRRHNTKLKLDKISKKECKSLKDINQKYPNLLDNDSKKNINVKCKSRLLSELI